MASDLASSSNPQAESTPAETFTLQIVSPSVGVPQPLALHQLPTNLTVKQLKERIRNAVSTKPADQAQRLIHRGRLLARDNETMTDIFGQETLRSSDHQTLHLVLRDLSDGRPAPAQNPLHAAIRGPAGFRPIVPTPTNPQQYDAWVRAMDTRDQNQRTATPGSRDTPPANSRGTSGTNTPGGTASPFQPDTTRIPTRENMGPNALQWRITLNETFINPLQRPGGMGPSFALPEATYIGVSQPRPVPNGGQLSNNEVQNILRTADSSSATRTMTDAMRRNASSSSLANLAAGQAHHPILPGVTTPLIPSRAGSATATPDPLRATGQPRSALTNQSQTPASQNTPEVYILSSPTGPRALLLNSSLETYFSPPIRNPNPPAIMPFMPRQFPLTFANTFHPQYMAPTPTTQPHIPPVGRSHITGTQAGNAPQQQPQAQPQHGMAQPPQVQHIGHAMARGDNPQVQAIRIAQIWPNILLVARLGFLIWLFSSPSSSWSRWIIVLGFAIAVFLAHTGLLNPIADQLWVPLRRRLENLIPLADGHQQGVRAPARPGGAQGVNGDTAANAGQQRMELDPADTAARLVQQRRNANANWLMDQVRRVERAGILFLASIAPGVAERHIAQVEADARAERRRQEAEAEAAAAAAAQQSEGQDNAEQNAEDGDPADTSRESGGGNQIPEGERGNERPVAAEEPLIAI